MTDEISIKSDHVPGEPRTFEQEIEVARHNMSRLGSSEEQLAYWTGMFDGLQTAFTLLTDKNGKGTVRQDS